MLICPSCNVMMHSYPGYSSIFECPNCKQLRTTARGGEIKVIKIWEDIQNVERV